MILSGTENVGEGLVLSDIYSTMQIHVSAFRIAITPVATAGSDASTSLSSVPVATKLGPKEVGIGLGVGIGFGTMSNLCTGKISHNFFRMAYFCFVEQCKMFDCSFFLVCIFQVGLIFLGQAQVVPFLC